MHFQNQEPLPEKHKKDPYRNRRRHGSRCPRKPLLTKQPCFEQSFPLDTIVVSWLGHSSVFLHINGLDVLIDPVFSKCLSPIGILGPRRFPGTMPTANDFPLLDAVLITHNHYDHLDLPTILALDNQTTCYYVPKGVGAILTGHGIAAEKIRELSWFQNADLLGLRIVCTPALHTSQRSLWDKDRSLWCSYVIQADGRSVFISGDTAFSGHFQEIHSAFGNVDLAIMECGQYGEHWHHQHMFPEESVEACEILHAKMAIPVHWGAFALSTHSWEEPPRRFQRHAAELEVPCIIPELNQLYYI